MSVHTVRSGDTLSALAKKYSTSVDKLAKANNIKNANQIQVGQKLTIPDSFERPRTTKPAPAKGDKFDSAPATAPARPLARRVMTTVVSSPPPPTAPPCSVRAMRSGAAAPSAPVPPSAPPAAR